MNNYLVLIPAVLLLTGCATRAKQQGTQGPSPYVSYQYIPPQQAELERLNAAAEEVRPTCGRDLDVAISEIEAKQPRPFTPVEHLANQNALLELGSVRSCKELGGIQARIDELTATEQRDRVDAAERLRQLQEEEARDTTTVCTPIFGNMVCRTRPR